MAGTDIAESADIGIKEVVCDGEASVVNSAETDGIGDSADSVDGVRDFAYGVG